MGYLKSYSKIESAKYILIFSFLISFIGLLSDNQIYSRNINILGFIIVLIFFFQQRVLSKSLFAFIMIIYFCSHFRIADERGGLFNIISFLLIAFYYLGNKNLKEIDHKDKIINLLLIVFILNNVLGWITKEQLRNDRFILGIISLLGYIFIFLICRNLFLTPRRIKIILISFSITSIYVLFTSINSLIKFIYVFSPLLTVYKEIEEGFYVSVLGRSTGEYAMLMFLFIFPFLLSNKTFKFYNLKKNVLFIGLGCSLLTALIFFSKPIYVLIPIGIISQLMYIYLKNIKVFNRKINFFTYGILLFIVIMITLPIFNLGFIVERFEKQPRIIERITDDIFTAKGTSREESYVLGIERLSEESWFIGYGWSLSNRKAWFGNKSLPKYDFHNLYYSLPQVFGWFGSTAFILLLFITLIRLWKILRIVKNSENYLTIPVFGFFFMLLFFLFSEYSINILSEKNYFMVFWIWLGLANSAINTFKITNQFKNKRKRLVYNNIFKREL